MKERVTNTLIGWLSGEVYDHIKYTILTIKYDPDWKYTIIGGMYTIICEIYDRIPSIEDRIVLVKDRFLKLIAYFRGGRFKKI